MSRVVGKQNVDGSIQGLIWTSLFVPLQYCDTDKQVFKKEKEKRVMHNVCSIYFSNFVKRNKNEKVPTICVMGNFWMGISTLICAIRFTFTNRLHLHPCKLFCVLRSQTLVNLPIHLYIATHINKTITISLLLKQCKVTIDWCGAT